MKMTRDQAIDQLVTNGIFDYEDIGNPAMEYYIKYTMEGEYVFDVDRSAWLNTLFGYDIGVMTVALPFLQTDWGLQNNATITGWITSAVMLGAIFGGAIAGQLSDKMGRRKMILHLREAPM